MKSGLGVVIDYSSTHEKEIPDGSSRRRMEPHRTPHASSQRIRTAQGPRSPRDPKRCLLPTKERLPVAALAPRLPQVAHRIDGLITNDKFCFTRRSRLKLRQKRRGYPSRKGVRRGGIDETELDRSTHDARSPRRRPSLGPGLCAPPLLGATQGNHQQGGA